MRIQPPVLEDKLKRMEVETYILDCGLPQLVMLGNCVSGTVTSSTWAPQGTVLALLLFPLHETMSIAIYKTYFTDIL